MGELEARCAHTWPEAPAYAQWAGMHGSVRPKEADIESLGRAADELARERGQKLTTTHLLAVIAMGRDEAAQLLLERRLEPKVILEATRVTQDDNADALKRVFRKAAELGARSPRGEVSGVHALCALCIEQGTAAHRAMVQCGIDITRLRAVTTALATGVCAPRRTAPSPAQTRSGTAPMLSGRLGPRTTRLEVPIPRSIPAPEAPPALAKSTAPGHTQTPAQTSAKPLPVAPSKTTAKRKPSRKAERFVLDRKAYPVLSQLGQNWTLAAARGELDPVFGREAEIGRALDILAKRQTHNVCFVGAPGVGKTAVVRGLAQRIADGIEVACFESTIVLALEASTLLAGTGVRGSLAERIAQIKAEVTKAASLGDQPIVLFFDEVHALFGADASDEASSELKTSLARGELRCIGATTESHYRRVIEQDPALGRCFTLLDIPALSPDDALRALIALAPRFETHHGCTYVPEALERSIAWCGRYVTDRALPDQAVQVLDLAGARARRRGERAVRPEHVAEIVSELTRVPRERLLETDADCMLRLEENLATRIVGQKETLGSIASVLRRNASGFRGRRPIGTFLFLGPTGVGKTETAKAIAASLFHSESAMTRLDLSEYSEAHSVARLIGSPPGYVGHDAGGQLTEAVRRRPYQVVLLDEVEKAHPDILEGFLQVFDEARLTDGRGRTVDFSNTIICMTSNLGADVAPGGGRSRIGFGHHRGEASAYQVAVTNAARKALAPEVFNRIDEILAFSPLTRADVTQIARRMLDDLSKDLHQRRGIVLEVRDSAISVLLDLGGFDPDLGARPMRRAIGRLVEAPLAELLLKESPAPGTSICVEAARGALCIRQA